MIILDKMEDDFYFDTSIWIDIYEKRGYNGEVAKNLFKTIIEKDNIISYSDLIVAELKRLGYTNDEINVILAIAKPDNLRRVHVYKEQIGEARTLAKRRNVPQADALHAILCRDNHTQLISRDKDYEKLKHITKAKLPEDFI